MVVRRFVPLAAVAVLLAGVIALGVPVSIPGGHGGPISCGDAAAMDFSEPLAANAETVANVVIADQVGPHTDYVAGCRSAVSARRAWSLAVAALGLIAAIGFTT